MARVRRSYCSPVSTWAWSAPRRARSLTLGLWLIVSVLACGDEEKAREGEDAESHDAGREVASERSPGTDDAGAADKPAPEGGVDMSQDAAALVASDAGTVDAAGSGAGSAVDRPSAGQDAGISRSVDAAVSAPPSVVRGDPKATYWDLRVRGVGLDRFEGKEVVVRLGRLEGANERLATGSARIVSGSFELLFPHAWEANVYKLKRGYIDVDGNGRCDPERDVVFMDARATRIEILDVPADFSMPTGMDFVRAFYPEEDCAALNERWPQPEPEPL